MEKLDSLITRTKIGETIAIGVGGASGVLEVLDIISPVLAVIATLFGILAGWYSFRLKRLEYRERVRRISIDIELEAPKGAPDAKDDSE